MSNPTPIEYVIYWVQEIIFTPWAKPKAAEAQAEYDALLAVKDAAEMLDRFEIGSIATGLDEIAIWRANLHNALAKYKEITQDAETG